jgi:hypothetical protein
MMAYSTSQYTGDTGWKPAMAPGERRQEINERDTEQGDQVPPEADAPERQAVQQAAESGATIKECGHGHRREGRADGVQRNHELCWQAQHHAQHDHHQPTGAVGQQEESDQWVPPQRRQQVPLGPRR